MFDGGILVDGTGNDHPAVWQECFGNNRRHKIGSRFFEKNNFLIIGAAFGIILFLVGVFIETLMKLTTATAVHKGVASVLAKILGDIVLIDVEVGDDDSLAEGGGYESQQ